MSAFLPAFDPDPETRAAMSTGRRQRTPGGSATASCTWTIRPRSERSWES